MKLGNINPIVCLMHSLQRVAVRGGSTQKIYIVIRSISSISSISSIVPVALFMFLFIGAGCASGVTGNTVSVTGGQQKPSEELLLERQSGQETAFSKGSLVVDSGIAERSDLSEQPKLSEQERKLLLDGTVILTSKDSLLNTDNYDPEKLFTIAAIMEKQHRDLQAIRVYQKLIDDFPKSDYVNPAWFNMGLLHEGEKNFGEAANAYFTITEQVLPNDKVGRRTWLDAHYRLAVCFGALKAWRKAITIFNKVLAERSWLLPRDQLEALVGRAIASDESGDKEGAAYEYASALHFYRTSQRQSPFSDHGLAAEAAFRWGELAVVQYKAVTLAFPTELLAVRLEEKCERLLVAQSRFVQAMRVGDAHTIAAAGFLIGHLYENLYEVMTGLEIPEELTLEQRVAYRSEVGKRLQVLLRKSISIYERALRRGRAASGTASAWLIKLKSGLTRLKTLYLSLSEEGIVLTAD